VSRAYERLPLGALRVFEAVATRLSFSAAADALNVTPAAVSQQIKMLEDYLQVALFRRNGRRVEVTGEGLQLLPGVRSGLEDLQLALQQIKQNRRGGPLQISLLASFLQIWLLPRIRAFRRQYPDVLLRFHTSRELVDFSRAAIHVAIRFGRGDYPNLHVEKLLDDWLVPVAHPTLIKQFGLLDRDTDLDGLPLLDSDEEPWQIWRQADVQRLAVTRAEHRRFRGSAGRGRGRPRLCVGALDHRGTFAREGHTSDCRQGGAAIQLSLLFCLPRTLPGDAQSHAIPRLAAGRGA